MRDMYGFLGSCCSNNNVTQSRCRVNIRKPVLELITENITNSMNLK